MDALKKANSNRKNNSFSHSSVSRTSFGSLLESISQTNGYEEQDHQHSMHLTPIGMKPKPTYKEVSNPFSLRRAPILEQSQNQSPKMENKINKKLLFQIPNKKFQTDGSNVSDPAQKKNVPKTIYAEKQRPNVRAWGTQGFSSNKEKFNYKNNIADSFNARQLQKLQIDQRYDRKSTSRQIERTPPKQMSFNKKSKEQSYKKEQQSIQKNRNLNIKRQLNPKEKTPEKINLMKIIKKTFLDEDQTSQLDQMNRILKTKKQKVLKTNMASKNFLSLSNSSNNIPFYQSKTIKGQKELGSIRSDYDYSKRSNLTATQRSKSCRPATGRRADTVREYTIAIIQYCSHQIGLACYNNSSGQFHLCQLVQNMTYFRTLSTVQMFSPIEIIYPQTLEKTLLVKKLHQKFRQTVFKGIFRRFFDQQLGHKLYMQTANHQDLSPTSKFLAFSCFNALVFHLESNLEFKLKRQSLNTKWHHLDQLLIIQPEAISDLEIFYNLQDKNNKKCLISHFHCITAGGTRILRANFLQPSSEVKIILQRQKLLQKLLQNPSLIRSLQKEFYKFKYYDPVTAKFIQTPKQQSFKSLKSYMTAILLLSKQCLSLQSFHKILQQRNAFQLPIFDKLDQKLSSQKLKVLRSIILQNFDQNILKDFEQVKKSRQRYIFLFKEDKIQGGFASITRQTYNQTVESIKTYFNDIKIKTNYNLHLMFNQTKGYYMTVSGNADLSKLTQNLQQDLVQIGGGQKVVTFSTRILSSLNNRLKQAQRILTFQAQSMLRKVIGQIQQSIDVLFEINQILSTIDMIMAFGRYIQRYSSRVKFVKPKFCQGTNMLQIKGLKPVWLQNDNLFEEQDKQLMYINVSDKNCDNNVTIFQKSSNSIQQNVYIASIGYTVILSQIGCFVPAQSIELTLFESILSKMHIKQSTQMGMSRYQLNLVKIQNILDNCFIKSNGKSLVLMDQIVRGTQHEEECAISLAIIKQLSKNNGKSFLLTSDRMLIKYLSFYDEFDEINIMRTKRSEIQYEAIAQISSQSIQLMKSLDFDKDFVQLFDQIKVQAQYIKKVDNSQKQSQMD